MRVEEQMTRKVTTCKTGDSLARAAKLLWDEDCGCLPVVNDRSRVLGMITDRDICMAALITGKSLADLRVRDAMAKDVATMRCAESTQDAELVMRERRVRRLPVVDSQGRLVGLLCCNDLVRWADDPANGAAEPGDAVHLLRTLATVGLSRTRSPDGPLRTAPVADGGERSHAVGYGPLRAFPATLWPGESKNGPAQPSS